MSPAEQLRDKKKKKKKKKKSSDAPLSAPRATSSPNSPLPSSVPLFAGWEPGGVETESDKLIFTSKLYRCTKKPSQKSDQTERLTLIWSFSECGRWTSLNSLQNPKCDSSDDKKYSRLLFIVIEIKFRNWSLSVLVKMYDTDIFVDFQL